MNFIMFANFSIFLMIFQYYVRKSAITFYGTNGTTSILWHGVFFDVVIFEIS